MKKAAPSLTSRSTSLEDWPSGLVLRESRQTGSMVFAYNMDCAQCIPGVSRQVRYAATTR